MNLLDILFPKRCLGCGKIGKYFCNKCSSSIRTIKLNETICPVCEKPAISGRTHPGCQTRYVIDGLTSLFRYEGIVRQAVKALKYRYVSDLAQEFINLIPYSSLIQLTNQLINPASPAGRRSTMLVPIPLHPSRLRQRGFNQAEVLGKLLASRLGITMRTDILKRIRKTIPQVEMKDRDERLKNMVGVFSVKESFDKMVLKHQNVKGQFLSILLFDDVFTTGATMRAAAQALKRAGVKFVWGITMVR
ncbi:MAG: ComF family protein [Patescibacteria group bacterium]